MPSGIAKVAGAPAGDLADAVIDFFPQARRRRPSLADKAFGRARPNKGHADAPAGFPGSRPRCSRRTGHSLRRNRALVGRPAGSKEMDMSESSPPSRRPRRLPKRYVAGRRFWITIRPDHPPR